MSRTTKCKLYETLIKPGLMYVSETWTCLWKGQSCAGMLRTKVLRRIFRGVNENGVWRSRYNFELYRIHQGPDIVMSIKIGRLEWLGHVMRMNTNDPSRKTLLDKPIGKLGRPRTRFMANIEDDLELKDSEERRLTRTNGHKFYGRLRPTQGCNAIMKIMNCRLSIVHYHCGKAN